jgi:hypothetical protein
MRRAFLVVALAAAAVVAAGFFGTGKALAYGPGEVAQVEVSGNCTNATWCNTYFGGTGGFWIWASLNSDNSVDATFAGCGHTVGGGGPGSAGAGGGPEDGTWKITDLYTAAVIDGALPMDLQLNSDGSVNFAAPYYEITLQDPHFGTFVFAVPVQQGHYNYSGVQFISGSSTLHISGVNFQTQVAP